jgi:tetratricopeptide (TPR) repeat protein
MPRALWHRAAVSRSPAARAASAAVFDRLTSLADKHLLRWEGTDDEPRFAMLETVREFAAERLAAAGEEPATRRAHAAHFLALAERAEPELAGAEQGAWLDRLETEHDNLRAAVAWSVAADAGATAVRLVGALWRFWWVRGHAGEGRAWADRALAGGAGTPAERARAFYTAGSLAEKLADAAAAVPRLEAGLAAARAAGDLETAARCHNALGIVAESEITLDRAEDCFASALDLFRAAGDQLGVAVGLINLGQVARNRGDLDRGEALLREGLARARGLGDLQQVAAAVRALARTALVRGDYERAVVLGKEAVAALRRLGDLRNMGLALVILADAHVGLGDQGSAAAALDEALELYRRVDSKQGVTDVSLDLASLALDRGEVERARPLLAESLRFLRALGGELAIAGALLGVARVAAALGEPERAVRLVGALTDREAVQRFMSPVEREGLRRDIAAWRALLGDEAFAAALAAGRELGVEQAIDDGLAIVATPPAEDAVPFPRPDRLASGAA